MSDSQLLSLSPSSYQYSLSGDWLGGSFFATVDVTFHIYVTLAMPDSNFTEEGGKVIIIAEYNGSAGVYHIDFGIEDSSGVLSLRDQQPIPGSETVNGDVKLYPIDFAQDMSMYKDGGNSTYNFPARYKRTFSLTGFSQSKYRQTSWSLKSESTDTYDLEPVTNGLQIFEVNRLTKAKCKLFFIMRTRTQEKEFTKEFDLDFSAETMVDAVVG
ncbi:hypothetical protein APHAL10511_008245 [Amanita phalloides]|nr:hypothetical protein APHAL10511_008245 [Amanita phalloides]